MNITQRAPVQKLHPLATGAAAFGAVLLLAWGLSASSALAQTAQVTPSAPPAQAGATRPATPLASASSRPSWNELTPAQQQALRPLAGVWSSLDEARKRKWLALSQNYPHMPAAEQSKLHSRMTEWAALSPQQRSQARLNFAETKQLAPADKAAQWEAYQALSPEQKQKLAAGAATKPPGAATAVKPVPRQKLAEIPTAKPDAKRTPKIAVVPDQVGPRTLLPQPAPAAPQQ
ncbi:MAG: DUF3106 domain-containing protein [Burkholderiaceae bacterium]